MEIQTTESTPESDSNQDIEVELNLDEGNQEQEVTEANEEKPVEPDYKEKFSASAKEAQRLIGENKDLQVKFKEQEARLKALEEEKNALDSTLKEERPEEYDAMKTKSELANIKKDLVLQKENNALNDVISEIPEAKAHKEALRKLGRAHPNLSYKDLWDTTVKPLMEAGAELYNTKQTNKRITQPEKGNDSKTVGSGDFNLNSFNKLSLAERKAKLDKMNIGEISL